MYVWLSGLGWTLYINNIQRMLNKDLTKFMQSLPRIHGNRQTEIRKKRNMSFGSLKGPKKGQQMNFYGLIKSRKRSIFEKK